MTYGQCLSGYRAAQQSLIVVYRETGAGSNRKRVSYNSCAKNHLFSNGFNLAFIYMFSIGKTQAETTNNFLSDIQNWRRNTDNTGCDLPRS